jgi:hypothetical protein
MRSMADRPARLWKELTPDQRLAAADAFWRDTTSPEIEAQHVEAIIMLARRLNFRTRSMQALPIDQRARHLARVSDVSDGIATRALIAYHFAVKRPLMSAFLDALQIPHDQGLITAETVTPPTEEALTRAVEALRPTFDMADVDLYLRTLSALDGETWANADRLPPPQSAS